MTDLDRLLLERLRQTRDQRLMVRANLDRRIEGLLGALERPWPREPALAPGSSRSPKEFRHD